MSITMEMEYELNRAWIIDEEEDEQIGETNFVVPADWLVELYNNDFSKRTNCDGNLMYKSFEMFLDIYEPEEDGEFIYQKAIEDGVLKEDLGVVYY